MFYSVDKVGRLLLQGADKAEAGEMDRVVRFFVFSCFSLLFLSLLCPIWSILWPYQSKKKTWTPDDLERRVGWWETLNQFHSSDSSISINASQIWLEHTDQVRRSRLDKLLDQAQKAGCDVALAKMVLATRLVVLTWLIWTEDPFAPLRALVDNKNIIFLLREMGAELKMTTLQVASWDQLINWWALRSNKMQTTKCFAEWNKSWN